MSNAKPSNNERQVSNKPQFLHSKLRTGIALNRFGKFEIGYYLYFEACALKLMLKRRRFRQIIIQVVKIHVVHFGAFFHI